MDKTKVLKDYIEYKKLSVHTITIKDIEFYIKNFIEYKSKPLESYEEKDLIVYINGISKHYANETLNTVKIHLKNFIKWHYLDYSTRFRNLDKICRSQKGESRYKPEDMISVSDFEKLIQGERNNFWKAYFVTLFYGCCRPIEVCGLKWKDIEFTPDGDAFFTIFSKKNKKSFLKYLPKDATYYLKQLQNNNSEYVFMNPETQMPITKKGAYLRIRNLSKRVLGKKIDLYTLRHSIATINYNKDGVKDDTVALQMGHTKSMKGTYTHNDRAKLKENAKKIYVGELLPEKKHELEIKIDMQNKQIENLNKQFESIKKILVDSAIGKIKVSKEERKRIKQVIEGRLKQNG